MNKITLPPLLFGSFEFLFRLRRISNFEFRISNFEFRASGLEIINFKTLNSEPPSRDLIPMEDNH